MLETQEDPILISARREALIVFACWLIAMVWSVSYCYLNGYITLVSTSSGSEASSQANADQETPAQMNASRISDKKFVEVRPAATKDGIPELWIDRGQGKERVTFVLGFPAWIFWGVALPWWVCTAFSLFFGAFLVRDEDLGLDPEAAAEAAGEAVAHA